MGDQEAVDRLKSLLSQARPAAHIRSEQINRTEDAANDPRYTNKSVPLRLIYSMMRGAAPVSIACAHYWAEDRWQTAIVWFLVLWPYAKKRWEYGQQQRAKYLKPHRYECKNKHKFIALLRALCKAIKIKGRQRTKTLEAGPDGDYTYLIPPHPSSSHLFPLVQYS